MVSLSNVPILIDLSALHNPGIETDNVWVPQSKHHLNLLDSILVASVSEQLQSGELALVEAFIDLAKAVVFGLPQSCEPGLLVLFPTSSRTRNKQQGQNLRATSNVFATHHVLGIGLHFSPELSWCKVDSTKCRFFFGGRCLDGSGKRRDIARRLSL